MRGDEARVVAAFQRWLGGQGWSDTYCPTPAELATGLELDPASKWPLLRADMPRRRAIGPGGDTAIVTDYVLVLSRATG